MAGVDFACEAIASLIEGCTILTLLTSAFCAETSTFLRSIEADLTLTNGLFLASRTSRSLAEAVPLTLMPETPDLGMSKDTCKSHEAEAFSTATGRVTGAALRSLAMLSLSIFTAIVAVSPLSVPSALIGVPSILRESLGVMEALLEEGSVDKMGSAKSMSVILTSAPF